MDKRVLKTQNAIFSAYMELSSKDEKYTIKEICDLAGINKSTFYRNFKDLDDFRRTISNRTVDYIMEHLKDLNIIFTNAKSFYLKILSIFEDLITNHKVDVKISRLSNLSMKLTQRIKEYFDALPNSKYNYDRAVFVTGGVIAFLERKGDVFLSEAIKDFRNNIDILSAYTQLLNVV